MSKLDYREYIKSDAWRDKHHAWLRQADNRCAAMPWVRVGDPLGPEKYSPYEMHHMSYDRLGHEVYGLDVVALSPLCHGFVHEVLGGHKQVRHQPMPYPNPDQRLFHTWCRLPIETKFRLRGVFSQWVAWKVRSNPYQSFKRKKGRSNKTNARQSRGSRRQPGIRTLF